MTVFPDMKNTSLGFKQVHPVLNHKNKTIENPNAFEINTSIQRCLVKAIALATGIGLHIYAGEDLPDDSTSAPRKKVADPIKGKDRQPLKYEAYENAMKANETASSLRVWWGVSNIAAKADLTEDEYQTLTSKTSVRGEELKQIEINLADDSPPF